MNGKWNKKLFRKIEKYAKGVYKKGEKNSQLVSFEDKFACKQYCLLKILINKMIKIKNKGWMKRFSCLIILHIPQHFILFFCPRCIGLHKKQNCLTNIAIMSTCVWMYKLMLDILKSKVIFKHMCVLGKGEREKNTNLTLCRRRRLKCLFSSTLSLIFRIHSERGHYTLQKKNI